MNLTIPRMTIITLGVTDLARATAFYREIFSTPPITRYEGVTFIPLPGVWLSLYPLEKLAEDIAEEVRLPAPHTFRGFSLAYNARSKEEIISIFPAPPKRAHTSPRRRRPPPGTDSAAISPTRTGTTGK